MGDGRKELARQAAYARLVAAEGEPAPEPQRTTRLYEDAVGWRWECDCGASSWRHGMDPSYARRDLTEHRNFGVMHKQAGFYGRGGGA